MPTIELCLTLQIRSDNGVCVEGECDVLRALVPDPAEYSGLFASKRWEVGPFTFERLIDGLIDPLGVPHSQKNFLRGKLISGVWDLLYREMPVEAGKFTPEGRLWPA